MNGKALSIKNNSKIDYLAKEISEFLNRGSATKEKISATLHLLRNEIGIKTLKDLEQPHIEKIASELKEKVKVENMSTSAAGSYISSINNIVKYIGSSYLQAIKASNYELSRNISGKDGINKENTREAAAAFKTWLDEKYTKTNDLRYAALKHAVNIQSVNLRLRESLLVKLGKKDLSNNILKIATKGDGSKNSRAREIKINLEQKATLLEARQFLKNNNLKNLNIGTVRNGRDFANNTLKAFKNETGVYFHFHGERHFQAHEAYKSAWQGKGYVIECRARTGETKTEWRERILSETGLSKSEFAILDKEIRQEISRDLGHERIEITSRYIG